MSEKAIELLSVLIDVEYELRRLQLWEETPPAPEALQSVEPFAVDTLTFVQWIQFIFIPKLRTMVEAGYSLPAVSGIAPMAEQYFAGLSVDAITFIKHLDRVDLLLAGKSAL